MNRNARANFAAEMGFPLPVRMNGQPAFADFGTIASVAGPVISGMMQSDSAENAANIQGQSSAAATEEQRRQYDQNRKDLAPYRQAGGAAVNKLSTMLGLGGGTGQPWEPGMATPKGAMEIGDWARSVGYDSPQGRDWNSGEMSNLQPGYRKYLDTFGPADGGASTDPEFGALNRKFTLQDFMDDPVTQASYKFGLSEGTKAIDRMAGARGGRNSGSTLKALTRFGTDYTGQQAGASRGRYVEDQANTYNRLAGVAGTGQTAVNTGVNAGTNMATNVGNIMTAQGNARGAAAIAGGNAMAGGLNSVGNWFQQQQMLKQLQGGGMPGYSTPGYNPNPGDMSYAA